MIADAVSREMNMSISASIISLVMKYTVRKQFDQLDEIGPLREALDSGASFGGKLPDKVSVVPQSIGDVVAEWVTIEGIDQNKVILYLHGGGYIVGTPDTYRDVAWRIAELAGCRVLLVDYRLAPEFPFPTAVEDATNAYRWLLGEGFEPQNIALCGDSAGGGLAVATALNLKNLGLPQPACAMLMSPWVDLACRGDSHEYNDGKDCMLTHRALVKMADFYLGDRDRKAPLASPLYGDLSGLCPMMIHVGSTEVLYSDSEGLAERVTAAGGIAEIEVWPKMPHVFPVFAARIPEGKAALAKMAEYFKRHTESEAMSAGA
ncbi:MAG: acetyl esterase/lipase [Candidatus Azotimanducaceae bacterium]|jgi:acetyl esterase/lipase